MLDLKINHLQLLAQIVSTGSLTEAAQNLGLSAAAASRMLKKLQTEMNDPLFIRVWRGLTPTDTTTMMLPVVRELLDQMERLEYQKSFTPAKLSATITIGAADNSVISILPPVVRAIREQAPKVSFRILPLESRQFQKLADGGMDFLLYPTQNLPDLPTHFFGLNLFRIERSVLMNRAHPLIKAYAAGQTLKAEDFRKYPRILVKLQDSSRGAIYDVTVPDPRLGEAFIELPYFLGAPYFLEGTEYTLVLPTRTAKSFEKQFPNLAAVPYPGEYSENFARLIWHERSDKSLVMQWVRSMFAQHAGEFDS